jgi:hypothetical protein
MDSNEFRKRVLAGEYLDVPVDLEPTPVDPSQIQAAIDKVVGVQPTDSAGEVFLLEMLVDLDIPGFEDLDESGNPTKIKLPYVVTLADDTLRVVGVRRNWKEDDPLKRRRNYYVHYVLVEGPGAYGLGFVHLVGGLSKGATTALRQLIDAGTLANLPAGFKARGARIADDSDPIQPGEWRDIDAGGAELSSSLLPLPYKEPSQVLFALLGFLVDAGKRLSSTADMQVGDGNQYAQVGTTLALLERGSMVMSAIHKRLHYAQSMEFRLLFEGFAEYLPDEYPYEVPGASRKIKRADFNKMVSVLPVADPNIFSTAQRIQLAQMQLQLAQGAPQMHNMYEAYYRVYAALNVRDIDGILLPQHTQMPRDPATENASVLNGMQLKAFAGQQHDAHIATHLMMGLSPILQSNPMAAMVLQQHILEHVRLKAEEDVEADLFKMYGSGSHGVGHPEGRHGRDQGRAVHAGSSLLAGPDCWHRRRWRRPVGRAQREGDRAARCCRSGEDPTQRTEVATRAAEAATVNADRSRTPAIAGSTARRLICRSNVAQAKRRLAQTLVRWSAPSKRRARSAPASLAA